MHKEEVIFYLASTQKAYYESDRARSNAWLMHLTFLVTACVLVVAQRSDEQIAVPLLYVTLNKWIGVELLLVLASACALRAMMLGFFNQLLRMKMQQCLEQLYGTKEASTWYLRYPSMISLSALHEYLDTDKSLFIKPIDFLTRGAFLLSIAVLVYVGFKVGFSLHWILSTCAILWMRSFQIRVTRSLPSDSERDVALARLESNTSNETPE